MNLRIIIAAFLCAAFSAPLFSQSSPEVIKFNDALNLAVNNSANVRRSVLEEKKLDYQRQEARGIGLPSINATGGFDDYLNLPTQLIPGEFFGAPGQMIPVQFGTTYNLSGSVDASQILYNQVFFVALKLASQAIEQGRLATEQVKTFTVLSAGKSYYATQVTRIQLKNQREILEKMEKIERVASRQYESGIIKKTDLDRISVEKLNLMTEIDRLEVLYQQELSFQRYLMGMPQTKEIELPDSVDMNVAAISHKNIDDHIEIRLIDNSRQLASTDLRLKRAEYFPSLALIGSTSYVNQSNTYYVFGKPGDWFNTSLVGLRLNVPVFDGFRKKSRVGQSKVTLEQINVMEDDTKRRLEVDMRDAERKLGIAITAEQRQRENQKLAERVYNATQEQYQKGVISLTDLLNVERALVDAQTLHTMALVNMKIAELDYMYANGNILDLLETKNN